MAGRIALGCLVLCLLAICLLAPAAAAHGGGLNAEGCHTNRKTGDYHCHRSGSAAPAPARPQALTSTPHPSQTQPQTGQTGWSYRNCTEARAAGAAPVRRGQPGYGPHLDRDNDGIGCE